MEVRRIRADEVSAYREMRMRALALAPEAYGTTLAEASARTDDEWRTLVHRSATSDDFALFVLDRGAGRLAGSAGLMIEAGRADPEIVQMWLDEDLRGDGWGEALVAAAEARALARGWSACTLWVEDDNPRARRFYTRSGYRPTGLDEPNRRGGKTLCLRRVLAGDEGAHGPVRIRSIRPAEGVAYREVRLRALRLAPEAFGSRLEDEEPLPESHWHGLVGPVVDGGFALYVVDRGAGPLAGTVYARVEPDQPDLGYVGAMWLDEDLRGGDWANRLLALAEDWTGERGAAGVHLWVSQSNDRAWRFYSRHGYQPTGVTQPYHFGDALELYRRFA